MSDSSSLKRVGVPPQSGQVLGNRVVGAESSFEDEQASRERQRDDVPARHAQAGAQAPKRYRTSKNNRIELLSVKKREAAAAKQLNIAKIAMTTSYYESGTEWVLLGTRFVNGLRSSFSASSPGLAAFGNLVGAKQAVAAVSATHHADQGRASREYGNTDQPFAALPPILQQRIVYTLL